MITKYGYVFIFDIETGLTIYTVRISTNTVFISTEYTPTNGIVGINRSGQVLFNNQKLIFEKKFHRLFVSVWTS